MHRSSPGNEDAKIREVWHGERSLFKGSFGNIHFPSIFFTNCQPPKVEMVLPMKANNAVDNSHGLDTNFIVNTAFTDSIC